MRIEKYRHGKRIVLNPGDYYVTDTTAVLSTLLGSCISACLYDPRQHVIGMNHFMLSNPRYSRNLPSHLSEAGRYGIQSMELLINAMMKKGADRNKIRAKVFGGAMIVTKENGNFSCVGEVNCRFIREFLENESIPVDAEDLGGKHGRVIHFSNGDFTVYRRYIQSRRTLDLVHRDRECWQRAIEEQMVEPSRIDLW